MLNESKNCANAKIASNVYFLRLETAANTFSGDSSTIGIAYDSGSSPSPLHLTDGVLESFGDETTVEALTSSKTTSVRESMAEWKCPSEHSLFWPNASQSTGGRQRVLDDKFPMPDLIPEPNLTALFKLKDWQNFPSYHKIMRSGGKWPSTKTHLDHQPRNHKLANKKCRSRMLHRNYLNRPTRGKHFCICHPYNG